MSTGCKEWKKVKKCNHHLLHIDENNSIISHNVKPEVRRRCFFFCLSNREKVRGFAKPSIQRYHKNVFLCTIIRLGHLSPSRMYTTSLIVWSRANPRNYYFNGPLTWLDIFNGRLNSNFRISTCNITRKQSSYFIQLQTLLFLPFQIMHRFCFDLLDCFLFLCYKTRYYLRMKESRAHWGSEKQRAEVYITFSSLLDGTLTVR